MPSCSNRGRCGATNYIAWKEKYKENILIKNVGEKSALWENVFLSFIILIRKKYVCLGTQRN